MVVTSDHGASPLPERTADGGRIEYEVMQETAQHAAETVLGGGTWVTDAKYPNVFFSASLLAKPDVERTRAIAAVVAALQRVPGIAWVEPATRFEGNCEQRRGDDRAICHALDPERSGDLVYMPKPHWIMQDRDEHVGTAHGSIYAYDRQVPLIVLAPDRAPHAPATAPERVRPMTDVAPLLASWLGVPPPLSLTWHARGIARDASVADK